MPALIHRTAARVVVVDAVGAVLIQLHGSPHEPHWACPGGGVEPGESLRDAAQRELLEETGRIDRPSVEVWTWEHDFWFAARRVRQHETYFLARTNEPTIPTVAPDLMDGIVERRWCTAIQLRALTEPTWPTDLADRIDALLHNLEINDD